MTAIKEYSATEAALTDLKDRYQAVLFDCSTAKGMDLAKKSRAEIKGLRVALEAKRVEIKAPALEHCRLIDAEAKRITAALVDLEDPIDAQIKAQEAKRDAEKREKERLEAEAKAAEEKAKKDAEEAAMAAERAAIAKEREALAAAVRAQEEIDRQARMKIEEEQRAARMQIEEEARKAREAREAADAEARKLREAAEADAKRLREAEEARMKAERDKIEAAHRASEEAARKVREAQEALDREEKRKAAELMDAHGLLATFVERFGHIKEFSAVVDAIKATQHRKAA